MQLKSKILDENGVKRALTRISHEIIERNDGVENVVLVGIKSRGVPLAQILSDGIYSAEGVRVPVVELDVRAYRDDLSSITTRGKDVAGMEFDASGKKIVLVDDVLYTGRTARAAMEAIIAMGRPALVQLAVLVDRGHRELPIRADYVGKNIPTSRNEQVRVLVPPYDEALAVEIYQL